MGCRHLFAQVCIEPAVLGSELQGDQACTVQLGTALGRQPCARNSRDGPDADQYRCRQPEQLLTKRPQTPDPTGSEGRTAGGELLQLAGLSGRAEQPQQLPLVSRPRVRAVHSPTMSKTTRESGGHTDGGQAFYQYASGGETLGRHVAIVGDNISGREKMLPLDSEGRSQEGLRLEAKIDNLATVPSIVNDFTNANFSFRDRDDIMFFTESLADQMSEISRTGRPLVKSGR